MSQRVTHARQLVAEGHSPSVVARVMQISRQAIYRTPKPRRSPQRRPASCEVERAIVEEAEKHPTDGYRLVREWVCRRLGRVSDVLWVRPGRLLSCQSGMRSSK